MPAPGTVYMPTRVHCAQGRPATFGPAYPSSLHRLLRLPRPSSSTKLFSADWRNAGCSSLNQVSRGARQVEPSRSCRACHIAPPCQGTWAGKLRPRPSWRWLRYRRRTCFNVGRPRWALFVFPVLGLLRLPCDGPSSSSPRWTFFIFPCVLRSPPLSQKTIFGLGPFGQRPHFVVGHISSQW